MYKQGISVRVLVNGRPVREYVQNGLSFIEARQGTSYTIKIGNDNSTRKMVVVSVDGLDVITGKAAEKSHTGYIVEPYSTTEIKGYKVSNSESAAFIFTSKDGSYTAQTTGNARNAGVIGVRVFDEKVVPVPPSPTWYAQPKTKQWDNTPFIPNTPQLGDIQYSTYSSSVRSAERRVVPSSFDQKTSYASAFDTGTGWGNKQTDKVREVQFSRGDLLCEQVIYYASREALISMGIDLTDSPTIATETLPEPFGGTKYCQPPKNWRG